MQRSGWTSNRTPPSPACTSLQPEGLRSIYSLLSEIRKPFKPVRWGTVDRKQQGAATKGATGHARVPTGRPVQRSMGRVEMHECSFFSINQGQTRLQVASFRGYKPPKDYVVFLQKLMMHTPVRYVRHTLFTEHVSAAKEVRRRLTREHRQRAAVHLRDILVPAYAPQRIPQRAETRVASMQGGAT